MEAQRSRLRTSIEELQRVVDDPGAFRVEQPEGLESRANAGRPPSRSRYPSRSPLKSHPSPRSRRSASRHRWSRGARCLRPSRSGLRTAAPAPPPPVPSAQQAARPPRAEPACRARCRARSVRRRAARCRPWRRRPSSPPSDAGARAGPGRHAGDALIDLTRERELPEGQDEGAFLAELRKAMTDDEPLGPREGAPGVVRTIGEVPIGRQRGRFGHRR